MAAQFNQNYQTIYDAGLARQREDEARRRALLGGAAARAGVSASSGGAQDEISREAARAASDLEGRVASAQEEDRQGEVQFGRQLQLLDRQSTLEEQRAARDRDAQRKARRANIWSQGIGGLVGAAASIAAKKYGIA